MSKLNCKQCGEFKELSVEFFKREKRTKLGFDTTCKECRNKKTRDLRLINLNAIRVKELEYRKSDTYKNYHKNYYLDNLEYLKSKASEKYNYDKEPFLKRSKEQKLRLGDRYKEYQKQYGKKNRSKISQKYLDRLHNDPTFKLKHNIRVKFRKLLKGYIKNNKTLTYLGCSIEDLKLHLESQFTQEMCWENQGSIWHVDHILPCELFDFSNEEEIKICWNYKNLRPLLALENLQKKDKLPNNKMGRDYQSYNDYIKDNGLTR